MTEQDAVEAELAQYQGYDLTNPDERQSIAYIALRASRRWREAQQSEDLVDALDLLMQPYVEGEREVAARVVLASGLVQPTADVITRATVERVAAVWTSDEEEATGEFYVRDGKDCADELLTALAGGRVVSDRDKLAKAVAREAFARLNAIAAEGVDNAEYRAAWAEWLAVAVPLLSANDEGGGDA